MEAFNLLETVYEKGFYGYDRMQDFALLIKQGQLSEDDCNKIRAEMESLNYEGKYFYSITAFIYYGLVIKESQ